jgi:hypothetical protein
MASLIAATTIDEQFPVAGTDNDTQGFRDNFGLIKGGLVQAAAEITELQDTRAKINDDNNFNGKTISNAVFRNNAGGVLNGGDRSGAIAVNFANGEFQRFRLIGNGTFTFEGFPTDNYAKIILEVEGDNTERTFSFPSDGTTLVKKNEFFPDPVSVTATGEPMLFEVITRVKALDPGALTRMIYINYIGKYAV